MSTSGKFSSSSSWGSSSFIDYSFSIIAWDFETGLLSKWVTLKVWSSPAYSSRGTSNPLVHICFSNISTQYDFN